jgi:hypothetical protein
MIGGGVIRGVLWVGAAVVVSSPALAGAAVVLEDGRVLEGLEVRREGDLVTLVLESRDALVLPASLVVETRLAQAPSAAERAERRPPSGIRVLSRPETVAGASLPLPRLGDQIRVFGDAARFRRDVVSPGWEPADSWRGSSADDWSPARWAAGLVRTSWEPVSAFDADNDVLAPGRSAWRSSIIDPSWMPADGFRGGA